jgi:hypothetical protein
LNGRIQAKPRVDAPDLSVVGMLYERIESEVALGREVAVEQLLTALALLSEQHPKFLHQEPV